MPSKLTKLKENFGAETVMLNVIDPVSKYYCDKDILRPEDEPIFQHLETCEGLTQEGGVSLINSYRPDYYPPMSGDGQAKWFNDLCKILCQCIENGNFQVNQNPFSIAPSDDTASNHLADGIDYLVSENPSTLPLFEATNVDDLTDNKLSDEEVLLLIQLVQPNKHRTYNPSQREILKKSLKDKNSSAYRVLSGNYLREGEEVTQAEAIDEIGMNAVANSQVKTIALVESNGVITRCVTGKKGYHITKFKF